ncbi:division/cell wall cluster transcriptional repressor MraZ [Balneicella halophila]|uniref:Transcriptional regulator MraZ n=1 Tax=Balneicella halophila TaxID=1537566 RepID=A0A7L4UP84_BALHA|nr:division/cell wall cluster transcriptional repressor MraZ [Balneicella halophila]PVX50935.1 division/cell wall cluster transcriptional repressor MraZ [Balneicella halophila]
MFIGDYTGKVDAKGRMIIPSQFRKNCNEGETFVVKQSIYDKSLDLFPAEAWKEEVARFTEKLNRYNRYHDKLIREYYRGTAEVSLDSSGRILLSQRLLDYAGIIKEVVVAGVGEKIVIWDKQSYDATEMTQEEFEDLIAKELG